jgi:hypothetical protein
MSSETKKPRFGMLKGVRDSAQVVAEAHAAPQVAPEPAPAVKDDATQEPFSCTLSRGMKRRLKKASADEDRKQYLLVEQALAEYLAKNHPDIK